MREVYVFDTVRTPRGKGKSTGSLHTITPIDLFAGTLRDLQKKTGLNSEEIDDVVCGCVTQVKEQGGCIARFAALKAGFGETVPGATVNRFCGSGLEAIRVAFNSVASGQQDLVVAGGVESMSRVAMGSDGGALWDASFQCEHPMVPQGISADLIATKYGFSRQDVDKFALESHKRAANARENGWFKNVSPVVDLNGDIVLESDETIRADSSLEKLSGLPASFEMMGNAFALNSLTKDRYPEVEKINHIHTAGNSSAIVDGAAATLLGSKEKGEALGLKPIAKIKWTTVVASEPIIMLLGPIPATKLALKKANMKIPDIDLFEVNEAFASVPLAYMEALGVEHDKLNVFGGAIALGHPLGATGVMLTGTLLEALETKNKQVGLVTLCIGGGMGICAILERV